MSFFPEEQGFFGKAASKVASVFQPKIDPKEAVRNWCKEIRSEGYRTDRIIREIEREKKKAEKLIKQYAKEGNLASAKIVAKEVVNCNKTTTRLYTQKAHLMDMDMALKNQLAMIRVAGTLQKSSEVMNLMSTLIKLPELHGTMRNMSKEMMKAGLIEEMIGETMDSVNDVGIEESADGEVNKVLFEIAGEDILAMPEAGKLQAEPTPEEKEAEMQFMEQLAAGATPHRLPEQA